MHESSFAIYINSQVDYFSNALNNDASLIN